MLQVSGESETVNEEAAEQTLPEATPITHTLIPGQPYYIGQQSIADCNTGRRLGGQYATLVEAGCDVWENVKFERPLTDAGDFEGALDINSAGMGYDSTWFFVKLQLFGSVIGTGFAYGVELDTDFDGRGDYLITALDPGRHTEWSVGDVQVWQDQNDDVGGGQPGRADNTPGDGYETLLFDSGVGLDPDLAWVRVLPETPEVVEFAFLPLLLGESGEFGWWTWSSRAVFDVLSFELPDMLEDELVSGIDNTCAYAYGGSLADLPNRCQIFVPTSTPLSGCIQRNDQWCNDNADPQGGGFPWWWDSVNCKCQPTN